MRIDKWLKVSRIIKRRGLAKDLCLDGDIFLNGKAAKPSSEINEGDLLEIHLGRHLVTAKVRSVRPFAKKEEADAMYEILSESNGKEENHA